MSRPSISSFSDSDTTEESADHRPGDPAGDEGPNRVSSTAQSLNAQLGNAPSVEKAYACSACIHAFRADDQGSPNTADTVDRGTHWIIDARSVKCGNSEHHDDAANETSNPRACHGHIAATCGDIDRRECH